MTTQDHYEILQVHPKADAAAIEAAYRRLIDQYDPARVNGAAEEIVELVRRRREALEAAYAVLSDPERRAAYDAELSALQAPRREASPEDAAASQSEPGATDDRPATILDYRPLPPAQRAERPRGFNDRPVVPGKVRGEPRVSLPLAAMVIAAAIVLPALVASLLLTGGGATPAPAATAEPSPLEQFELLIAEAKRRTEQSPDDVQTWIDYGNLLYDSVQIVREQAPDSELYRQQLPRWLDAIAAYERALELDPDNAAVRADKGASACFYGVGTGQLSYLEQGLAETERALEQAPDDARALLSHGYCLVSVQPPRTEQALAEWRRILEIAPADSPIANQARLLIDLYSQE
ncbi:MAG: DnaJ domain-containing protein [Chloroflexota bacterium]|nr:MAG: molecular chaperone DnaJ [Chloroflexota bacterium]